MSLTDATTDDKRFPDAKEMMEADKILGKSKKDESKGPSKKVKAKVDKIWESMNFGHSKMPKFKSLASLQRKGKKRTTNADEYILAHDLDKKAPRNISVKRLKWFSVGKKVYKINRLEINDDITIVMFDKIKFNHLKLLMTKGDINE